MKIEDFQPFPKDLHGWQSDSPVFKELIEETQPKNIVEVGTWKGASAVTMAKAARELGLDTKIYCVDTWLGSLEFQENERKYGKTWDRMLKHGYPQVYYQFLSNIIHEGVVDMIEAVPMVSRDAAPFVPEAELIYIDANHYYQAVLEDIWAFWAKLKPGGVIFGDDYFLTTSAGRPDGYEAGVKKAVDEVAQDAELEVEVRYNNFWILRK